MIKLSALFWLVLVSATGFATFAVKYEVQAVADELAQTTKRSDDAERDIRVLGAEWAYLNRPDALAQMNQRYLSLAPMATKQLIAGVSDVPMRPAPPPVAEPAVAVAENSPPTATPPTATPPTATPASISVVAQYPAETQPSMRQSSSPSQPPASAGPRRDRRTRNSGAACRAGETGADQGGNATDLGASGQITR